MRNFITSVQVVSRRCGLMNLSIFLLLKNLNMLTKAVMRAALMISNFSGIPIALKRLVVSLTLKIQTTIENIVVICAIFVITSIRT